MHRHFFQLDPYLPVLPDQNRQPVMFLGHGSPMNALGGVFFDSWQALGQQFGAGQRWAKPRLILCISAHWLTRGWWLTGMAQPKTIHDFGGFPPALFAQHYPAPGAPEVARVVSQVLSEVITETINEAVSPGSAQPVGVDPDSWGLDHGSWGVLKPMFAQADIPVVQLSMDAHRSAPDHVAVGRALGHLRQRGVLVVGSGNVVHNLPAMQPQVQPHSWAADFDNWVAQTLTARDMQALQNWQTHPAAPLAHPSIEHFLPLLYAAGAADGQDEVTFFNTTFQAAAISMRSVVWA